MAAPSGIYRVSGSRPRLPTTITLFTDAMSRFSPDQFTYRSFIPLPRNDFQAHDALLDQYLRLAHASHIGEGFIQPLDIHTRCDAKRESRKPVDRPLRRPHAQRRGEPQ